MKKSTILCAAAAIACGGFSSAFAQIQVLSGQPNLAPRLVATSGVAQEEIPNPFDFFASEDPSSIPSTPAPSAIEPTVAPEIMAEVDESPSDAAADSLPVGRRHRQQSMTETILDHATVLGVPHTGMAPVCWSAPDQTPNPIASVMLRQECNQQALWDGYSAQRAAECARMWQHIAGQHRCAHGNNCKCANANSGCTHCAAPARNRYTEHLHGQHSATCDSPPAVVEAPLAPNASCSTTETAAADAEALLQSIAPPQAAAANVANLPFSFNR